MNMQGGTPRNDHDDRFDAAMRNLHRGSLGQLSPQVRWRLKPAAPEAKGGVAGRFGDFRIGPLWAGAFAAMFAVAVGVGLWRNAGPAAPAAAPAPVAVEDAATVLGEDPDFYAWLASADADLVAME